MSEEGRARGFESAIRYMLAPLGRPCEASRERPCLLLFADGHVTLVAQVRELYDEEVVILANSIVGSPRGSAPLLDDAREHSRSGIVLEPFETLDYHLALHEAVAGALQIELLFLRQTVLFPLLREHSPRECDDRGASV